MTLRPGALHAILTVGSLRAYLRFMPKSSGSFTSATAKKAAAVSPMHKPGWKTKATIFRKNVELLAQQKGISPLELFLGMTNDETLPLEMRKAAADSAARYVHKPMPQAVEMTGQLVVRRSFAEAVGALAGVPPDEGSGD